MYTPSSWPAIPLPATVCPVRSCSNQAQPPLPSSALCSPGLACPTQTYTVSSLPLGQKPPPQTGPPLAILRKIFYLSHFSSNAENFTYLRLLLSLEHRLHDGKEFCSFSFLCPQDLTEYTQFSAEKMLIQWVFVFTAVLKHSIEAYTLESVPELFLLCICLHLS